MKYVLDYGDETSDTLLRELAEESERYLSILKKLGKHLGAKKRDELEGELYASISHLRTQSQVTLECLDDLVDALPEDEEVPA